MKTFEHKYMGELLRINDDYINLVEMYSNMVEDTVHEIIDTADSSTVNLIPMCELLAIAENQSESTYDYKNMTDKFNKLSHLLEGLYDGNLTTDEFYITYLEINNTINLMVSLRLCLDYIRKRTPEDYYDLIDLYGFLIQQTFELEKVLSIMVRKKFKHDDVMSYNSKLINKHEMKNIKIV